MYFSETTHSYRSEFTQCNECECYKCVAHSCRARKCKDCSSNKSKRPTRYCVSQITIN